MLYKLPLKNRLEEYVVLCTKGYEFLVKAGLIEFGKDKLFRKHSAGYAVHQKWEGDKCTTTYLHKFIATHFIVKQESPKRLFVRMKNGNKLDCRIENLEWVTMGMLRRHMKPVTTKTGYRGVIKDKNSYRSVLNVNGVRMNLGTFKTAEEAAAAYNAKSTELFGITKSLNKIEIAVAPILKVKKAKTKAKTTKMRSGAAKLKSKAAKSKATTTTEKIEKAKNTGSLKATKGTIAELES